jgi:hypothetical protein
MALLMPLCVLWAFNDVFEFRKLSAQIRSQPSRWVPILIAGGILAVLILATRERGLVLTPPNSVSGLSYVKRNLAAFFRYLIGDN